MSDLLTPAELAAIHSVAAMANESPGCDSEYVACGSCGWVWHDGPLVGFYCAACNNARDFQAALNALLRHIAALEAGAEAASPAQIEAAFKEGYDIACDGSYDWSVQKDNYYKKSEAFRVVSALEARTPAPALQPTGHSEFLSEGCFPEAPLEVQPGANFKPTRDLDAVLPPAPATDVDALLADLKFDLRRAFNTIPLDAEEDMLAVRSTIDRAEKAMDNLAAARAELGALKGGAK